MKLQKSSRLMFHNNDQSVSREHGLDMEASCFPGLGLSAPIKIKLCKMKMALTSQCTLSSFYLSMAHAHIGTYEGEKTISRYGVQVICGDIIFLKNTQEVQEAYPGSPGRDKTYSSWGVQKQPLSSHTPYSN